MIQPEGCFRAYLKPGQELPDLRDEELQKAIREGLVISFFKGKQAEPPEST